ncbi:MAG: TRAP transporter small permease [Marinomonas foliarum]|jgi:TRAP-type C4-dicarboxylate transport system permease small subunit|uniref:TRAP transporter small permease protein n=1 Tax=Marinomonas foliarum TaxID=491950 RepID=A0A368ZVZ4_9GAMM|nr:TRAP transporter small permease [Marinomonas foliarum]QRV23642.1 TRAP transporter small permease [Marinomonas foliarum]RCX01180.1 TRAP-type C4-dicarboxylate transport system permease small subunit [Marinomonas foliarum]
MAKFIHVVDRILSTICVTLMVVLVSCVVWQVFSRYVLGAPSTSTDELARFLFIWVALLGAAFTLGQKKHLAMDFVLLMLDGNKKATLQLVITFIGLFFAAVIMVYGGGSLMMKTLSNGQLSPVLGLQMGWVYSAIPISGVCMILYLVRDLLTPAQD